MQDRRIKRTRKSIFDALVELMLEKDIGNITVRELCERADVNKSTFYLHFMDIYDCRDSWSNELLEDIFSRISLITYDDILNNPEQCLNAFFDFFEQNLVFYEKMLNSPLKASSMLTFKDKITEIILQSNNLTLQGDFEKVVSVAFYLGGVIDACVLAIQSHAFYRERLLQLLAKQVSLGIETQLSDA
ncbi:MAG: TetR/AcrR family transcriptional regulator [Oscillospiraceae bacterium]|jgi:AcrR family transcriptional regulator|nr:TetR/AcrR family transcriptional regulator [Oscillospiraceae bacterium]